MRRRLGLGLAAFFLAVAVGDSPAAAQTVSEQIDAAHSGVVPGAAIGPPLKERWRRVLDPSIPVSSTVGNTLAADGRVFVTAKPSDGKATLYALDPGDGHTLWSHEFDGWMRGAGYGGGRVLVSTDSTLYALDAATGAMAWSRSVWPGRDPPSVQTGAVVAGDTAYIGVAGYGSAVYALDIASGSVRWSKELYAVHGMAVGSDRLFVNAGTSVVALRRGDGGQLWSYTAPNGLSLNAPAYRDGRVYVPDIPDAPVLDAATGTRLRGHWMDGRIASDGERDYVISSEPGEWHGNVLEAVGSGDGTTQWELGGLEGIVSFPIVSGDTVYAMGVRGVMYAADRRTGELTWCGQVPFVNSSAGYASLAADGGLLVLAVGGEVVALGPGGTPGCDYYGTGIPRYHDPVAAGAATARAAAATPPGFEPNRGQLPASVRFAARGAGHALLLDRAGATLSLGSPDALGGTGVRVRLRVRGARPAALAPSGGGAVLNDYRGPRPERWRTGIRLYDRVRARGILPGIDMVFRRGTARRFEYDFVVAPGADPRRIALRFDGAARPRVARSGALVLGTPAGVLRQPAPFAYQRGGGKVRVRFALAPDGTVRFRLGRYDRHRALVIDPVLEWSSFLGGGFDDRASAIATDASGNVYVAGSTNSRDFPIASPVDGYDERNAICSDGRCTDAFVAKYAPGGTRLVHVTYLSGFRDDSAQAIAADADGNAYVTGFTMSPNFPTRNALQPSWACGGTYGDAFVVKLAPDGSALDYSTYLGGCRGSAGDVGRAIAVDSAGRAVVGGDTDSFEFPTTPGAADRVCAQSSPNAFCNDAFVARLSADGKRLEYSTLFGGDDSYEFVRDMALDSQGRPVIAGFEAGRGTDDFPGTPGAYEPEDKPGFSEVFAARLSADGSALQWASGFGGADYDEATGLALDAQDDVHLTGTTESDDFPTTAGAWDRVCNIVYERYSCTNHYDAFALELSADGSTLLSSTYFGGGGYEHGGDIALDGQGRAYLTGTTSSSPSDGFPVVDAFQPDDRSLGPWCASRADCSDAYFAVLDPGKSAVLGSSLLGGRSQDEGEAIALDGEDAWVAGTTWSTDLATTRGAAQPVAPGGNCDFYRDWLEFKPCMDAFVARIGPGKPPAPQPSPSPSPGPSPSPSPGPSPTPTPTPSPTATPTPRPDDPGTAPAVPTSSRRLSAAWHRGAVTGRLRGKRVCIRRARVVLERRRGGRWRRVRSARTSRSGRFRIQAVHRSGRYRVRTPAVRRTGAAGPIDCRAASRAV
jgi:outer membrane protein assembly factor BamB